LLRARLGHAQSGDKKESGYRGEKQKPGMRITAETSDWRER
jgi:hypothetical protein